MLLLPRERRQAILKQRVFEFVCDCVRCAADDQHLAAIDRALLENSDRLPTHAVEAWEVLMTLFKQGASGAFLESARAWLQTYCNRAPTASADKPAPTDGEKKDSTATLLPYYHWRAHQLREEVIHSTSRFLQVTSKACGAVTPQLAKQVLAMKDLTVPLLDEVCQPLCVKVFNMFFSRHTQHLASYAYLTPMLPGLALDVVRHCQMLHMLRVGGGMSEADSKALIARRIPRISYLLELMKSKLVARN